MVLMNLRLAASLRYPRGDQTIGPAYLDAWPCRRKPSKVRTLRKTAINIRKPDLRIARIGSRLTKNTASRGRGDAAVDGLRKGKSRRRSCSAIGGRASAHGCRGRSEGSEADGAAGIADQSGSQSDRLTTIARATRGRVRLRPPFLAKRRSAFDRSAWPCLGDRSGPTTCGPEKYAAS